MGPAVALLAVAWVALLVAAPLLPTPLSALFYVAGSLICHQIPDRSFHLQEFQLPVCARCLGLYAGAAAGCLAGRGIPRTAETLRRGALQLTETPRFRGSAVRHRLTLLAALPTAITWALEWGAGVPFSNVTRMLAALPLGATVAVVVMGALATLHYGECLPRRPIGHGQPPATNI